MLVYRDAKTSTAAEPLLRDIGQRLSSGALESALLTAGAVECALADAGSRSWDRAQRLTDAIADAWVGDSSAVERARAHMAGLVVPPTLPLGRPEGFAFYALDPLAFRALARDRLAALGPRCAIIGVRSIGTTLSAIVRAELARGGVRCERRTVRPTGHPFERTLRWSAEDAAFVERARAQATFVVVDEGPGLSGSTLLSVAEALSASRVSPAQIRILCSNPPCPERLLTSDAVARWSRFTTMTAPRMPLPAGVVDASGGAWRTRAYGTERRWPASWVEQERVKYLSASGDELVKFSGFPPYDEPALERATALAEAGWAPRVRRRERGFLAYEWVDGDPLERTRDRAPMIRLLARYLAFRVEAFPATGCDPAALESMARTNVHESMQRELPTDFTLEVRTPVHADGHLMPHEWIRARDRVVKTDAVDHGDDHLFPGPCDVAWDVAGAVVEWELEPGDTAALLAEFARLSGDDPSRRLWSYVVAYAAFRIGLSTLAERNPNERSRWRRARRRYERLLRVALERHRDGS